MAVLAWAWGAAWLALASLAMWPWVNRWFRVANDSDGVANDSDGVANDSDGVANDSDGEAAAPEWRVLRWPLTVGLGWGLLTLWLLVAGFWRLNAWIALAFPAVLVLLAAGPAWRSRGRLRKSAPDLPPNGDGVRSGGGLPSALRGFVGSALRGDPSTWVTLAGLALFAAVLGQATYYPFVGDDEISRYAYYARLMFVEGRVTEAVRGYPMFMPMAYLYVFLVTGQLAEQLARVIPALISAMTVLATGALGARWFGPRAGPAAALALMVSPLYLRWSPDGYVDIASALYFVLCAYAADVWRAKRQLRWAALAGLLAGLALWTKQAGFAALACLGLVIAGRLVLDLAGGRRAPALQAVRDGLAALGLAILAGGLWYLRNAYFDGWGEAVPGPGIFYFQQARTAWEYLIPFVGYLPVFGEIASVFYLAGLAWSVFRFKRAAWALIWAAPYTLLWWRLFSYDARFLLTVLPFYAILFGGLVAESRWPAPQRFWRGPAPAWLRRAAAAAVAAAMLWGAANSGLGGLRRWVLAPAATYAERLYRAKGGLYPTVEFLRDHVPASARLLSMDGRIKYYLIERAIGVGYPTALAEVRRYDYFVVGSWWSSTYAGLGTPDNEVTRALDDPQILEPVFYSPGYALVVYRIVQP